MVYVDALRTGNHLPPALMPPNAENTAWVKVRDFVIAIACKADIFLIPTGVAEPSGDHIPLGCAVPFSDPDCTQQTPFCDQLVLFRICGVLPIHDAGGPFPGRVSKRALTIDLAFYQPDGGRVPLTEAGMDGAGNGPNR